MDRPHLPLNALRAFEASARHRSFTRAAIELCVTQAAVSHQVKNLEAQLGVALFRRLPRGLMVTEEGEALLPVVLALRQWGEDWGHGCQEIFLADIRDGQPVRRICVLAHDGRELKLGDMMWVDKASGATVKHPTKG